VNHLHRQENIDCTFFLKIFTICKEIKQHHLVIHWVLLCLKNFMQLRSKDSSIWALTCLLLAVSDDSLSQAFFQEIAKEICIDEDIFIYSVSQFYNYQGLNESERKGFSEIFSVAEGNDLFSKVLLFANTFRS